MVNISTILEVLPEQVVSYIRSNGIEDQLQEIRMRINSPIIFITSKKEYLFNKICKEEMMNFILKRISSYSIYAFEEEIKNGFLTIKGGHRIGICGTCVIEDKKVKTIRKISSINIRVAREVIGCSDSILQYISKDKYSINNTIIISPPKCGKTTLLRDIARNLSKGYGAKNISPQKICIIDERSEIASCHRGIPQMNVGERTDVLDCCPKSIGIMMAIRSMSPDVIICDEIGTEEDIESIFVAVNSGVKIIASIHGYDVEDFINRSVFKKAVQNQIFDRAIVLNNKREVGKIEYIYDFKNKKKVEVI